jgi:DNA polymerase
LEGSKTLTKSLLKWYLDSGVEFNLSKVNKREVKQNILSSSVKEVTNQSDTVDLNKSDSFLEDCKNLESLHQVVLKFSGCALKRTAKNTVFSDGNPNSKIMLLGEAPGEQEDKEGVPFLGEAGLLLDKMLNAIGQNRKNTYLSNIIFWRPPGNRKPTEEEVSICMPLVQKHIELVKPKILILAGAIAAKAIYGIETGITQLRGNWKTIKLESGLEVNSIAIFHPAFLLRQPARKKEAWEDLKKIKMAIDSDT